MQSMARISSQGKNKQFLTMHNADEHEGLILRKFSAQNCEGLILKNFQHQFWRLSNG